MTSQQSRVVTALVYAGFWRRCCATFIDFILLLSLLMPFYILIQGLPITVFSIVNHWLFNVIWLLGLIGFWTVLGATPGKRLLNINVVKINTDNSISDLTLLQSLLRALVYLISLLPLGLGFVWIAFDKSKRGFHDMILSTAVIIVEDKYEEDSLALLLVNTSK